MAVDYTKTNQLTYYGLAAVGRGAINNAYTLETAQSGVWYPLPTEVAIDFVNPPFWTEVSGAAGSGWINP